MAMAADYEFSRVRNGPGCKSLRVSFRTQRQMQPDFMYAAVASGEVDVASRATPATGLIAKYDLVVLDDPSTPSRPTMPLFCWRQSGRPIRPFGKRYGRCSVASIYPTCARQTCVPPGRRRLIVRCRGTLAWDRYPSVATPAALCCDGRAKRTKKRTTCQTQTEMPSGDNYPTSSARMDKEGLQPISPHQADSRGALFVRVQ